MATFTQYVEAKNKNLKDLSNEEIYYLLLEFVKEAAAPKPKNDSKRKVYYISAEFLIGKLLSNNLINLGIYKDVKAELDAAGKSISEIEDVEPEPSLGNGGLGRLASCFIDSMATLGINGEGVGLIIGVGEIRHGGAGDGHNHQHGRQAQGYDLLLSHDSFFLSFMYFNKLGKCGEITAQKRWSKRQQHQT